MDSHRSQCVSKGQKDASLTFIIVYPPEKKREIWLVWYQYQPWSTMVPTMVPWYQSCPSSCAAIPSSSCSVCCHSETLSQQLIAEFTAMTWDRQIPWTWTLHDMAMAIQNMLKHPKHLSRKMATTPLSLKNPGLLLTGLLLKVAII